MSSSAATRPANLLDGVAGDDLLKEAKNRFRNPITPRLPSEVLASPDNARIPEGAGRIDAHRESASGISVPVEGDFSVGIDRDLRSGQRQREHLGDAGRIGEGSLAYRRPSVPIPVVGCGVMGQSAE